MTRLLEHSLLIVLKVWSTLTQIWAMLSPPGGAQKKESLFLNSISCANLSIYRYKILHRLFRTFHSSRTMLRYPDDPYLFPVVQFRYTTEHQAN
jgi:hypothetical protein